MTVLELLAGAAGASEFEHLPETARLAGASDADRHLLDSAVRTGLQIHEQIRHGQEREKAASALVDVARELATPYPFADLLQVITRRTRHLLGLDYAMIALFDEHRGVLEVHSANGQTSALGAGLEFSGDVGLARVALTERSPIWSSDYLADRGLVHDSELDDVVRAEGLRGIVAVPLQYGTRLVCAAPIGVLYGATRSVRSFTVEERSLIGSVGGLAGLAIENARLLTLATDRAGELEGQLSAARIEAAAARELVASHDRLTDLAIAGDPQGFVAEAARCLDGPVRLLVGGTVVAGSHPDDATCPSESAELAVSDAAARAPGGVIGPVALENGVWAGPVLTGYDQIGTVLLTAAEAPDRHLFAGVLRSASVLLRCTGPGTSRRRDEILDDLLSGTPGPGRQLEIRARTLGFEPGEPSVLVVVEPEERSSGRVAIWASGYARRGRGITTTREGRVVLLVTGTDPGAAARAAAADMSRVLGGPVTAGGAGPLTTLDALEGAYEEAGRCLEATTALGATGGAASARELGFLGVLLSGSYDVQAFVDATIGPVLTYDRERFANLAQTLDAYFAAGASPTRAAERLHVHPNTVARRLDRIKALLGPEWTSPDRALDIQLALHLNRVRGAIGGPQVPEPDAC